MNAVNVGNPSSLSVSSVVFREFTRGKSLMPSVNLENHFLIPVISIIMREFAL